MSCMRLSLAHLVQAELEGPAAQCTLLGRPSTCSICKAEQLGLRLCLSNAVCMQAAPMSRRLYSPMSTMLAAILRQYWKFLSAGTAGVPWPATLLSWP